MKPHILIFEGTVPKNLKSARYVAKNVEPIGRLEYSETGFRNSKTIIGIPAWGLYKSDISLSLIKSFGCPANTKLEEGDTFTVFFQGVME